MSGIGGYVRRSERHNRNPVLHFLENCPYCGVSYEDVKAGRAPHPVNDGLHPAVSTFPLLRFVPPSSSPPGSPYRSEVVQDEPTRCWFTP